MKIEDCFKLGEAVQLDIAWQKTAAYMPLLNGETGFVGGIEVLKLNGIISSRTITEYKNDLDVSYTVSFEHAGKTYSFSFNHFALEQQHKNRVKGG